MKHNRREIDACCPWPGQKGIRSVFDGADEEKLRNTAVAAAADLCSVDRPSLSLHLGSRRDVEGITVAAGGRGGLRDERARKNTFADTRTHGRRLPGGPPPVFPLVVPYGRRRRRPAFPVAAAEYEARTKRAPAGRADRWVGRRTPLPDRPSCNGVWWGRRRRGGGAAAAAACNATDGAPLREQLHTPRGTERGLVLVLNLDGPAGVVVGRACRRDDSQ